MPSRLALIYEELEEPDFRILRVIEKWLNKYEYVPVEIIERDSKLPPSKILKSIKKLSTHKLVKRRLGSIIGYTLTYLGLDVLALRGLIVRGVIERIGDRIGSGKESEVYLAVAPTGERLTVKMHREGSAPFRRIKRTRSFAVDLSWGSMLQVAKILGEREFKVLVELHGRGASVPEPIAWNRHAVVTRYIESGVELSVRPPLSRGDAVQVLRTVLSTLRIAYTEAGVVHGDLSEYNVVVALVEGEPVRAYVIDWPQYVYKDEPHAEELLERDVYYITRFLRKIYGVETDPEEALRYVKGETDDPGLPH